MHIRTRTLTYIHTHVHHTCVCTCVCLSVCVCVLVYIYYVYVCIHVCVGVCSCHTFMVNYTCRYFRDTTLNICKCPSKDLSIEDTGWQSNCSFFQEELAYYYYIRCLLYCVMCVSMIMFVYDFILTCIGIYVYYTIIHNTFMLLK